MAGETRPGNYAGDPTRELSICAVEKVDNTERLWRMNLAVHEMEGNPTRRSYGA